MKPILFILVVVGGWQLWQFATHPASASPSDTLVLGSMTSVGPTPDSPAQDASSSSAPESPSASRGPPTGVPPTSGPLSLDPEPEGCIPGLVGVCHRVAPGVITFLCLTPHDAFDHEAHGDEVRVPFAARCAP